MTISYSKAAAALAILTASVVSAPLAHAQITSRVVTEARTAVLVTATSGDVEFCPNCLATTSNTGTVIAAGLGVSQSDGFGTALTDFGALKSYAAATSSGFYGRAAAVSTSSFNDSFAINSAALTGAHGTVQIPIDIGYDISRSGAGVGVLTVTLLVQAGGGAGNGTYQRSLTFSPDGSTTSNSFDPGIGTVPFGPSILATVDFIYGQPISVTATLIARAVADMDASFTLDASHSVYWGGFRSVLDSSGNAVAYTVTSASNTDWSQSYLVAAAPVPEPSAYALLLAGLGVIAFARRRHCARVPL